MSGRRRTFVVLAAAAAVVVAAVVAFVGLRGNGSGVGVRPTATPSSTPVVSPTQTATPPPTVAVPELPAAAQKRTQEGAEAFFRYFIDVYNYSFSSLDTAVMRGVSAKSCKFCAGVTSDVQDAVAKGLRYEGATLRVVSLAASPGDPKNGLIVTAIVDQDEGRTITADGISEVTVPESKKVRIEAGLRWVNEGWQVFAVTLPGTR